MTALSYRAFAGLAIIFFGFAAFTAGRMAIAQALYQDDTPESVRRAIAIQGSVPSAEFVERLAELDPTHARSNLAMIVASVNPRDSAAWIALGLSKEEEGDPAGAEQDLLAAADVDHQYLPAWTLTNFYFRHQKQDSFWKWADRSASLIFDEYPPLFQLCDRFEPDPGRMLGHFRDARRIRAPYLRYLMSENRLDSAQFVARSMADDRANDPHLIDLADRQIRAGNGAAGIELWNLASGLSPVDPASGKILTNGDLRHAPQNLGFDWRLSQVEGVGTTWRPSELIFKFSGSEPANCVLLEQTLFLTPHHFRLRFDYMTGTLIKGIRWSLDDTVGPVLEPSGTWKEGVYDLPRTRGLANLNLRYQREPGTIRIEGRMEIRNLRLEPGGSR
jgi:hypothetical protein